MATANAKISSLLAKSTRLDSQARRLEHSLEKHQQSKSTNGAMSIPPGESALVHRVKELEAEASTKASKIADRRRQIDAAIKQRRRNKQSDASADVGGRTAATGGSALAINALKKLTDLEDEVTRNRIEVFAIGSKVREILVPFDPSTVKKEAELQAKTEAISRAKIGNLLFQFDQLSSTRTRALDQLNVNMASQLAEVESHGEHATRTAALELDRREAAVRRSQYVLHEALETAEKGRESLLSTSSTMVRSLVGEKVANATAMFTMQKKVDSVDEVVGALQDDLKQTKRKLRKRTAEVEALRSFKKRSREKSVALRVQFKQQLADLKLEMAALKKGKQKKQEQMNNLSMQASNQTFAAQAALRRMEDDIDRLHAELSEAEGAVAERDADIAKKEREIELLRRAEAGAREGLDAATKALETKVMQHDLDVIKLRHEHQKSKKMEIGKLTRVHMRIIKKLKRPHVETPSAVDKGKMEEGEGCDAVEPETSSDAGLEALIEELSDGSEAGDIEPITGTEDQSLLEAMHSSMHTQLTALRESHQHEMMELRRTTNATLHSMEHQVDSALEERDAALTRTVMAETECAAAERRAEEAAASLAQLQALSREQARDLRTATKKLEGAAEAARLRAAQASDDLTERQDLSAKIIQLRQQCEGQRLEIVLLREKLVAQQGEFEVERIEWRELQLQLKEQHLDLGNKVKVANQLQHRAQVSAKNVQQSELALYRRMEQDREADRLKMASMLRRQTKLEQRAIQAESAVLALQSSAGCTPPTTVAPNIERLEHDSQPATVAHATNNQLLGASHARAALVESKPPIPSVGPLDSDIVSDAPPTVPLNSDIVSDRPPEVLPVSAGESAKQEQFQMSTVSPDNPLNQTLASFSSTAQNSTARETQECVRMAAEEIRSFRFHHYEFRRMTELELRDVQELQNRCFDLQVEGSQIRAALAAFKRGDDFVTAMQSVRAVVQRELDGALSTLRMKHTGLKLELTRIESRHQHELELALTKQRKLLQSRHRSSIGLLRERYEREQMRAEDTQRVAVLTIDLLRGEAQQATLLAESQVSKLAEAQTRFVAELKMVREAAAQELEVLQNKKAISVLHSLADHEQTHEKLEIATRQLNDAESKLDKKTVELSVVEGVLLEVLQSREMGFERGQVERLKAAHKLRADGGEAPIKWTEELEEIVRVCAPAGGTELQLPPENTAEIAESPDLEQYWYRQLRGKHRQITTPDLVKALQQEVQRLRAQCSTLETERAGLLSTNAALIGANRAAQLAIKDMLEVDEAEEALAAQPQSFVAAQRADLAQRNGFARLQEASGVSSGAQASAGSHLHTNSVANSPLTSDQPTQLMEIARAEAASILRAAPAEQNVLALASNVLNEVSTLVPRVLSNLQKGNDDVEPQLCEQLTKLPARCDAVLSQVEQRALAVLHSQGVTGKLIGYAPRQSLLNAPPPCFMVSPPTENSLPLSRLHATAADGEAALQEGLCSPVASRKALRNGKSKRISELPRNGSDTSTAPTKGEVIVVPPASIARSFARSQSAAFIGRKPNARLRLQARSNHKRGASAAIKLPASPVHQRDASDSLRRLSAAAKGRPRPIRRIQRRRTHAPQPCATVGVSVSLCQPTNVLSPQVSIPTALFPKLKPSALSDRRPNSALLPWDSGRGAALEAVTSPVTKLPSVPQH